MKKILSLALALIMILSLSTVAFAAVVQDGAPIVPKTYKVNNGTAPAETFTYTFTPVSYKNGDGDLYEKNADGKFVHTETVTDEAGVETTVTTEVTIPTINDVTISFDAISEETSKTTTANVNADSYELGVYTYEVNEVAGNTAGVTYSTEKLYLVLTVLRDEDSKQHYFAAMHYMTATGDKTSGFTNEYDAGSLSVTKDIKGNMADMDKEFAFTIVFTAPANEVVKSAITVTKPDQTTETINFADGKSTYTYTINLGDDDTVTFTNIPEGVTYTVEEDKENYTSDGGAFSDKNKSIAANDKDTVTFTNTLTNEVDTGINMDSMPYILLLAVACMGLFVFISKKRMMREF